MKYIVIGLGNFGSKLASNLTMMGHEVIGIDNHQDKIEEIREEITIAMKMDCTNINAVKTLPLNDVDAVVVAIGEDVGASILALSILKNLNVKRIIGRAISTIHKDILKQIGIEEVVLPLEDSAIHVSTMLQLKNIFRVTEINEEYAVAEVILPEQYSDHMIETVDLEGRFRIKLIALKTAPENNMMNTIFKRNYKINLFYDKSTILQPSDILVVSGRISDIKRFIES